MEIIFYPYRKKLIFVDHEDNKYSHKKEENSTDYKEKEAVDNKKKAASSLAKEQKDYLLGRTVKNDIKNKDGSVIIKKDTVITADTIFLAENKGLLIDLTLEVE